MIRQLLAASALSFVLVANAPVFAQALPGAPPPPSADETKLAKVDSVPRLLAMGAKLQQAGDWRRYQLVMKRILELRPHAGNIRIELAAAYAMQGMKTEAYDVLVKMIAAGYAYDIANDARFDKVSDTKVWDYVVENFARFAKPTGVGKVAFTLPAGDHMFESVAYDEKRKQFLVGSVRTGEVAIVAADGSTKPLVKADADNGLWGAFDLLADSKRDLLWVASSAIPHVKHAKAIDYGRAGLFRFRLSDGKFLGSTLLPKDRRQHILSSVTGNPRGDVFVADSVTGQVFKLDGKELRLVVQNPKLASIRAIAASGDDKTLYFADYELGVFGLDLATGRAFDVPVPPSITLFSIESMYWYDGSLVAVQNGFPPQRTVRFKLSSDGRRIVEAQPLDAAKPELSAPTRGVVANDRFYVVANSQKAKYDIYGIPRDASKLERVRVYESDARYGWSAKGQMRTQ